jgi:adenosylmethionine-8-amino-7-oxononanoate aminotransferase
VTIFPTMPAAGPIADSGLPIVGNAGGCCLYDAQDRDYLGGSSGVLNVNVGRSHPVPLPATARPISHR